jgi:hypothetical protein
MAMAIFFAAVFARAIYVSWPLAGGPRPE